MSDMHVLQSIAFCGILAIRPALAQASGERDEPVRRALSTQVVGCYALFAGAGKRVDSDFYNASSLVRLASVAHPAFAGDSVPSGRRLVIRLDTAGRRLDPINPKPRLGPVWWADSLSDSIDISFTTGFSGAFLVLAPSPSGDTLRGYIEDHWDFGDPTRVGTKAYAVRMPCVN